MTQVATDEVQSTRRVVSNKVAKAFLRLLELLLVVWVQQLSERVCEDGTRIDVHDSICRCGNYSRKDA